MSITAPDRRLMLRLAAIGGLAGLAGCGGSQEPGPDAVAGRRPDATVEMEMIQAAYIGSGSSGTGVVTFRGRRYPFSLTGAGIGGIGASTVSARGEVFNLRDIRQFAGTYGQARYGFAAGTVGGGQLWLQNESGVVMELQSERRGLMLSLGADALVVTLR